MSKSTKFAGLQELLPWMCPVTPELVLQKDGSLLANFEVGGIDVDDPSRESVLAAYEGLDRACKGFHDGITAFWRVDRRRTTVEAGTVMKNALAGMVEKTHLSALSDGSYYKNTSYLSVLSTPLEGLDKFFSKVGLHLENGKNVFRALWMGVKETVFASAIFAFNQREVAKHVSAFESQLNGFVGGTPSLKLKRLRLGDQYQFLHQTANPAVPKRKVLYPESMMDNALAENLMFIGKDKLLLESAHGKKFVAAVAFKEFPRSTSSAVMDRLMSIDEEISVCTMFRFLSGAAAHKTVSSLMRHYRFTQFSIRNLMRMAMKAEEEEDKGRLQIADEAEKALSRITTEKLQFGYANVTVLCYADSADECDDVVKKVVRVLAAEGYGAVREDFNVTAAWASTLPGQWKEQKRLHLLQAGNISDIAPILSCWEGEEVNEWLTEQMGSKQGALTTLPTRLNTLTRVNFHVEGGSGHVLLIGPTGAGKSIFLNFLTFQTERYRPRRFTFDRDGSCRISTLLNGGQFIDMSGKFEAATKINPLCLLADKRHIGYVTEWVQLAIESYGQFRCTAVDSNEIAEAVRIFSDFTPSRWRLLNFVGLLPQHLQDQLSPWCEGGKEAEYFDHVEDAFGIEKTLADEVCIEMGELMDKHPKAAALAIDYFFYRINDRLREGDPRPTYIKIEEGSFFLTDPVFSLRLRAATITVRKKNGNIWLATQSLMQVSEAPGFTILQESFKNKILLPNAEAKEKLYCGVFGFSENVLQMVKTGVVNRDYIWINPKITRVLRARFGREIVAVTRSDEKAQNLFDKHYRSGQTDWKRNYIKSVLGETA